MPLIDCLAFDQPVGTALAVLLKNGLLFERLLVSLRRINLCKMSNAFIKLHNDHFIALCAAYTASVSIMHMRWSTICDARR
jgi:hypothetical protein